MKSNIFLIGFLTVVFACNGAEKKNNNEPDNFENIGAEEMIKEEERNEAVLAGEEKDESFEPSSEEGVSNSPKNDSDTDTNSQLQESMGRETSEEVLDNPVAPRTTEASENLVSNDGAEKAEEEKKSSEPITIFMEVVPDEMRFDLEEFTVTAGQEVIIELENLDGMEHNLLISKPGTLKEVGAAADALARDPKGAEKHYVPEIPEVLFATEMLDPGDFATLKFIAPKEPGEYPFVCTFPGHWRMMNGVMKVVAAE